MHALRERIRQLDRRFIFWFSYSLAVLTVAVLGGVGGLIFGYALDLPAVEDLENERPGTVTEILSSDGKVIGQLALEKRILIRYQDIPTVLKDAVLAIEDAGFFEHAGIDFRRVFITFANNLLNWERKGASTLTMQLSKLRFTSYEPTWERKIKDALYALEIEKSYSKEQILTYYFNQVYLGHGIYGMATGADFYFSKTLDQISLTEAALLAGIIRWPPSYSPINSPERAKQRRDLVLRRMRAEGMIAEEVFEESLEEPVRLNVSLQDPGIAPYAVEAVRQALTGYGYDTDDIWNRGMKIHTTIDFDLQIAAKEALRAGLKAFDKQHNPWKKAPLNILDQGGSLEDYSHPEWRQIFYPGLMVHGLVLESDAKQAQVKIGSYVATQGPEEIAWTGKKKVDQALRKGDVAVFTLEKIDRNERTLKVVLDRIPEVQGSLFAVDNHTGAIRAMVGGFDYQYSEFNRATQALRQPGSIFKPFTYVVALEEGYGPLDTELDEAVTFFDGLGRPYEPKNSDEKHKGLLPLYQALGESRNVPTLRLANKLGIEKIIEAAHRFGIQRPLPPYLPTAIGAGEITLEEITSAFSSFANKGVRAHPYLIRKIEDYDGTLLREHRNRVTEVVSAELADKMLFLLRGVVEQPRGTARRALALNRPVAGKTGTTNDWADSWFVGILPRITSGVWVGHETKKTLGEKMYGNVVSLPIWIDFIQRAGNEIPAEDFDATFYIEPNRINYAPDPEEKDQEGPVTTPQPNPGRIKIEDIPPPPPPRLP